MKLNQVKDALRSINTVAFRLPSGESVPEHFHVTEVGKVVKDYIDCGGTLRKETAVSFQLWTASDHDHRLQSQKLLDIIGLSESLLNLPDAEVEVEYQGNTINRYRLAFDGSEFLLLPTQTDCLAKDKCGIPQEKQKRSLANLASGSSNGCEPGSGCC
jgi:hypothetical protein